MNTTWVNKVTGSIALALTLALPQFVFAGVGDGPRAYQAAPIGTNLLVLNYMYEDTAFNIDGSPSEPAARIEANVAALQYTRLVDLGGRTTGVFAVLPLGEVEGSLIGTRRSGESSGMGDMQLGTVVSLIGVPAMTKQEFGKAKPDFSLGVLGKISAPTGEYSSSKTVNLGTNRWAMQLGLPMNWSFRNSYIPGQVTTLELTPAAWFYADNSDPTGGASKQSRDPLYSLEVHLTHDVNKKLWVSLDTLYANGGATVTDGVDNDNGADVGELGVTAGYALGNGYGLQVSYGQTLKSNTDGLKDDLFRIKLSKSF